VTRSGIGQFRDGKTWSRAYASRRSLNIVPNADHDNRTFPGPCVVSPLRSARDDHELDRDQDREHDHADDDVAADDECAEGRDQRADAAGIVPLGEDQTRGAHVEREPEQRRKQQRGGRKPRTPTALRRAS